MTAIPKTTVGEPVFRIKQDATREPIEYVARDAAQQLVPLIGATQVEFIYRLRTALPATTVTRTATIVDAAAGQVRYQWVAEDTAVPGDYFGEWLVTFLDGTEQRFPIRGQQLFVVEANLG